MTKNLQYVVHSIPNIALSIGIVTTFSANPRENHLMDVNRIMRYLKGLEEYGLYYQKNEKFKLRVYIDVDWVGNIDDKKSTSRGEFFLGKRLVPQTSKKQNCISQSTAEAEYVAIAVNCTNGVD